jgi:hypothetical protein
VWRGKAKRAERSGLPDFFLLLSFVSRQKKVNREQAIRNEDNYSDCYRMSLILFEQVGFMVNRI